MKSSSMLEGAIDLGARSIPNSLPKVEVPSSPSARIQPKSNNWIWYLVIGIIILIILYVIFNKSKSTYHAFVPEYDSSNIVGSADNSE